MTITITKRGYWCLRVVYTSCQGLESDGRNFLAAIVLPGDQEGLFKLAVQLRHFFNSVIYNTATGYVLLVYFTNI
jgi:hypothetical protein